MKKLFYVLLVLEWALFLPEFAQAQGTSASQETLVPKYQRQHSLLYFGDKPDSEQMPQWERTVYKAKHFFQEEKFDEAQNLFKTALDEAKQDKDQTGILVVYNAMCEDNSDPSIDALLKTLVEINPKDTAVFRSVAFLTYLNQSRYYVARKDYPKAHMALSAAQHLLSTLPSGVDQTAFAIQFALAKADFYREQHRFAQAITQYQRVIMDCQKIGYLSLLPDAQTSLANIYLQLNNDAKAGQYLVDTKMLYIKQSWNPDSYYAYALDKIAKTLLFHHSFAYALRYAIAAKELDTAMFPALSRRVILSQILLMMAYDFNHQEEKSLAEMKNVYPKMVQVWNHTDELFQSITITYICLLNTLNYPDEAQAIQKQYLLRKEKAPNKDCQCKLDPKMPLN